MFIKTKVFFTALIIVTMSAPIHTFANYFTLPVDVDISTKIKSWFDHDTITNQMTRYDGEVYSGTSAALDTCTDGEGCYDGHNGIDFATTTGANIQAPADGQVVDVWFNTCGGWQMHLWHSDIGLSTLYSHLSATTTATSTSRESKIGEVGSTGSCSTGPHLHFGVLDGYATSTSNRIDPYGWWATTTDPWAYNQGYLWTTYPPSFDLASSTGDVTANTTWRGNILINGVVTIGSGVTLNIDPGTVVKFQTTGSGLIVEGTLNSNGSTSSPVYFTSYKDDSVGGDTNGDSTSTTPAASDWKEIKINSGGNATFSHSIVRYGANSTESSNIFNNGGILNFNNSTSTLGVYYSIRGSAGTTTISSSYVGDSFYGVGMRGSATTTISNSKLSDNDIYGIDAGNYPYYTSLTLTNNKFDNNSSGTGYFDISNGLILTNSGNTASGSGPKKFDLYIGTVASNKTVKGDGIPYVLYNTTVNSGSTLTVEPGAMIKFLNSSAGITVNGTLNAQGATTSPIYFTSYNDDSVGGDSNGSATSPTGGDWTNIKTNSGGTATLSNAILKYGTTNVYNSGGTFNFSYSTTSNASSYGSRSTSGTISIIYSDLNNEYFGLSLEGGTLTFTGNNISTTTTYGLQNTTGSSVSAENNYWGASSGPYHSTLNPSGTGAAVWGVVDFDPWMTNWP